VAHLDLQVGAPTRAPLAVLRRLALRGWVFVTRWHLDAELAAGGDPGAAATLQLRAEQITALRYRRRLALSLLRLSNEARARAKPRFSAAIPVRRDQIAESRETLASVAQVLLFAGGVHARGVAMVHQLLADGGSPVYSAVGPGALEAQLEAALRFLEGEPPALPKGARGGVPPNEGSVGSR
jgi:hypothetical protein